MLTEEEARIMQEAEDATYARLMAAEEERQHAEAQHEHDLDKACEFLLSHGSLIETWERLIAAAKRYDAKHSLGAPF